MNKQIDITIDAEGAITVEAQGFKGKGCKAATDAMEQALGKAKDTRRKPEFRLEDKNYARH